MATFVKSQSAPPASSSGGGVRFVKPGEYQAPPMNIESPFWSMPPYGDGTAASLAATRPGQPDEKVGYGEIPKQLGRTGNELAATMTGTIPEFAGAVGAAAYDAARAPQTFPGMTAEQFQQMQQARDAQVPTPNPLAGAGAASREAFGLNLPELQPDPQLAPSETPYFGDAPIRNKFLRLQNELGGMVAPGVSIGAGTAIAGPLGGGALAGTLFAAEKYQELKDAGVPDDKALRQSALFGGGSAALFAIPVVASAAKFLPPGLASRVAVVAASAAEMGGKGVALGGVDALSRMENIPQSEEEWRKGLEDVVAGVDNARSSFVSFAIMGGVGGMSTPIGRAKAKAEAQAALDEFIDLGDAKVRERQAPNEQIGRSGNGVDVQRNAFGRDGGVRFQQGQRSLPGPALPGPEPQGAITGPNGRPAIANPRATAPLADAPLFDPNRQVMPEAEVAALIDSLNQQLQARGQRIAVEPIGGAQGPLGLPPGAARGPMPEPPPAIPLPPPMGVGRPIEEAPSRRAVPETAAAPEAPAIPQPTPEQLALEQQILSADLVDSRDIPKPAPEAPKTAKQKLAALRDARKQSLIDTTVAVESAEEVRARAQKLLEIGKEINATGTPEEKRAIQSEVRDVTWRLKQLNEQEAPTQPTSPSQSDVEPQTPVGATEKQPWEMTREEYDLWRIDELNRRNPQLGGALKGEIVDSMPHDRYRSSEETTGMETLEGAHSHSTVTRRKNARSGTWTHEIRHMIDMLLGGNQVRAFIGDIRKNGDAFSRLTSKLKEMKKQGAIDPNGRLTDDAEVAQVALDAFYSDRAGLREVAPDLVDFLEKMGADKYADLNLPHRKAIEQAIASGKSVPPEVLAGYPDITPTPAPTPTTIRAAAQGYSVPEPPVEAVEAPKDPESQFQDDIRAISAESKEKRLKDLRREFMQNKGLSHTQENGIQQILHMSSKKSGSFQLSSIGADGIPNMDQEFDNISEAIAEFDRTVGKRRADLPDIALMLKPGEANFIYEPRLRPVDIGTIPKEGFVGRREGGKWGRAAFNRPLTEKELDQYELTPIGYEDNTGGSGLIEGAMNEQTQPTQPLTATANRAAMPEQREGTNYEKTLGAIGDTLAGNKGVVAEAPKSVGIQTRSGSFISNSARNPGKYQVTHFTPTGEPAGHEEYDTLTKAVLDNPINDPLMDLPKNAPDDIVRAHIEQNKLGNEVGRFGYSSPYRPFGIMSPAGRLGITSNIDNIRGVLFTDEPLTREKQEDNNLWPATMESREAAVRELLGQKYGVYENVSGSDSGQAKQGSMAVESGSVGTEESKSIRDRSTEQSAVEGVSAQTPLAEVGTDKPVAPTAKEKLAAKVEAVKGYDTAITNIDSAREIEPISMRDTSEKEQSAINKVFERILRLKGVKQVSEFVYRVPGKLINPARRKLLSTQAQRDRAYWSGKITTTEYELVPMAELTNQKNNSDYAIRVLKGRRESTPAPTPTTQEKVQALRDKAGEKAAQDTGYTSETQAIVDAYGGRAKAIVVLRKQASVARQNQEEVSPATERAIKELTQGPAPKQEDMFGGEEIQSSASDARQTQLPMGVEVVGKNVPAQYAEIPGNDALTDLRKQITKLGVKPGGRFTAEDLGYTGKNKPPWVRESGRYTTDQWLEQAHEAGLISRDEMSDPSTIQRLMRGKQNTKIPVAPAGVEIPGVNQKAPDTGKPSSIGDIMKGMGLTEPASKSKRTKAPSKSVDERLAELQATYNSGAMSMPTFMKKRDALWRERQASTSPVETTQPPKNTEITPTEFDQRMAAQEAMTPAERMADVMARFKEGEINQQQATAMRKAILKEKADAEKQAKKEATKSTKRKKRGADPNHPESGAINLSAISDVLDPLKSAAKGRPLIRFKKGLPESVFDASIRARGLVNRYERRAQQIIADFEQGYRKSVGGAKGVMSSVPDNLLQLGTDYLTERSPAGKQAILSQFPEEMHAPLRQMRTLVDEISQRWIEWGVVSPGRTQIIKNNKGSYLSRQYKIFNEPNFRNIIPEMTKQRMRNLLRKWDPSVPNTEAGDDIIEGRMNEWIDVSEDENSGLMWRGSPLGARNFDIMKQRNDFPQEVLDLWGVERDVTKNLLNTVMKQAKPLANTIFQNKVLDHGRENNYIFTKADIEDIQSSKAPTAKAKAYGELQKNRQGTWMTEAAEQGKSASPYASMGVLADVYVPKPLKKAMEDMMKTREHGLLMKTLLQYNGIAAMSKTVGSVTTQSLNFIANQGFFFGSGYAFYKPLTLANRINQAIAMTGTELKSTWGRSARELAGRGLELGVMNDADVSQEIAKLIEGGKGGVFSVPATKLAEWGDRYRANRTEKSRRAVGAAAQVPKWIQDVAGTLRDEAVSMYQAGDDFWKALMWLSDTEYQMDLHPSWSRAKAEEAAAVAIREYGLPFYSESPRFIQNLRYVPIPAPFKTYAVEAPRILINQATQAKSEIFSGNATATAMGFRRSLGQAFAYGMPIAGSIASALAWKLSDQDEDTIRDMGPEWNRDSNFVHYNVDRSKGIVKYWNVSRTSVQSEIGDPINAFIRGDEATDKAARLALASLDPFLQEQLGWKALRQVIENEDDYGRPIYNDADTDLEFAKKVGSVLGKSILPGTVESVRRILKDDAPIQKSLAEATGQRITTVNMPKELEYATRSYMASVRAPSMDVKKAESGGNTSDITEQKRQRLDYHKQQWESLHDKVSGMKAFGVDTIRIMDALKKGGMSQKNINNLMYGIYVPPESMQ